MLKANSSIILLHGCKNNAFQLSTIVTIMCAWVIIVDRKLILQMFSSLKIYKRQML